MRISIAHVDESGHVTLTETEVAQGATAADRLDVAAPLTIDPMEARRLRAQKKAALRDVSRGRHGGRHRLAVSDV